MFARRSFLLPLLLTASCASAPSPAERERADDLARSLARLVRLDYDLRLHTAGQGGAPTEEELREARADLSRTLEAATGRTPETDDLGEAVRSARNVLLRNDYVFLPTAPHPTDPGIALARVVERETGLSRELWGRTVHYRRIVHDGVLLPGFQSYAALRAGTGPLSPLGRFAGPTIYLDQAAIARRAGKPGPYAKLTPEGLRELEELRQIATILHSKEVPTEELVLPSDRNRALVRLQVRVLLTLVRYGDAQAAMALVQALTREKDQRTAPEVVLAAREVRDLLTNESESSLAAEAAAAYADLQR